MKKIILVIAFIMAFTIGGYAYSWPQLGDNERICLPMSTLHCEPIKSFIETYLIPLYKENKGTYYVDRPLSASADPGGRPRAVTWAVSLHKL